MNTIVGILDAAFHLTDEEQVFVFDIVGRLLDSLDIPHRSDPLVLPVPLVLEITSGIYSVQLNSPAVSGLVRPVRAVGHGDIVVSVETWRESLAGLLITAYPDLNPLERMVLAKVLTDLLDAIGLPDRAAVFFPDDVVRTAREVDA